MISRLRLFSLPACPLYKLTKTFHSTQETKFGFRQLICFKCEGNREDSSHLSFCWCVKMGLFWDSVVVVSSQVIFFIIGWIFFVQKLFRDYELRHRPVQLVFCANLALSCTMFELILFEVIDCLEKSSRYFHW